jgi:hypothetical protein
MNAYKRVAFVGIVLFLFGVVISIYGFSFLLEENELSENGVIVKGKVVDINQKDIYRSPFVEFTTLEGEKITFLSPLDVNVDFFQYEIGDEVEVIYNKNNPKHAQINAFWERNTAQMYLGFLGVFLMLFGLLFRRRMLRKAKRYS